MKAKEQWIKETMESMDDMHRADAGPFLYEEVIQKLQELPGRIVSFNPQVIWKAAACLVFIAGINLFTCLHYGKSGTASASNSASVIAGDYFSYLTNNVQF